MPNWGLRSTHSPQTCSSKHSRHAHPKVPQERDHNPQPQPHTSTPFRRLPSHTGGWSTHLCIPTTYHSKIKFFCTILLLSQCGSHVPVCLDLGEAGQSSHTHHATNMPQTSAPLPFWCWLEGHINLPPADSHNKKR